MKKIYIIPTTTMVAVNVKSKILEGSLPKNGDTTVEGGSGGWTKENNSDWGNIWDK